MLNENSQIIFLNLCKMVMRAFDDAKQAHKLVFENKEHLAIAYLNSSIAKFFAAEALYYSNPDMQQQEIDETFHQFHVFSDEMLRNCRTNHSHQWTNIEYEHLVEQYDLSGLKLMQ